MAGKHRAELRVVVRKGSSYAPVAYVSLARHGDIYSGPLGVALEGDEPNSQRFRQSYHKDGNVMRKLTGRNQLAAASEPTDRLIGLKRLQSSSVHLRDLSFQGTCKPDTKVRKTVIIDESTLQVPTFTWEALAFSSWDLDIFQTYLEFRSNDGRINILSQHVAGWTNPILAMLVWSVTPETFASLPNEGIGFAFGD
jgi:hypothetical protein